MLRDLLFDDPSPDFKAVAAGALSLVPRRETPLLNLEAGTVPVLRHILDLEIYPAISGTVLKFIALEMSRTGNSLSKPCHRTDIGDLSQLRKRDAHRPVERLPSVDFVGYEEQMLFSNSLSWQRIHRKATAVLRP